MTRFPLDFIFAATGTTKTLTIHESGYISDIIMDVPNYSNTINTALAIQDDEGYELYNSGNKTQGAVYHIPTAMTAELEDIPVGYGHKAVITLDGAAGTGGGTVKVRLYIKQNRQQ